MVSQHRPSVVSKRGLGDGERLSPVGALASESAGRSLRCCGERCREGWVGTPTTRKPLSEVAPAVVASVVFLLQVHAVLPVEAVGGAATARA